MMQIQTQNLTKQFGTTTALDHVNVTFGDNKIYGLLGRNGAGKSTLLNIISNRIFTDEGQVTLGNMNAQENDQVQSQLYLMSEATYYPQQMKIKDALYWSSQFYPNFDMDYALKLSKMFGLDTKKAVKGLSTGYGSIMKIVIALSVNTPFVFFDEPVLGLDANHRELFYKVLLEKYSTNPFTVVISTHLIEEISSMIEHIVIIKEGKIIKDESAEKLLSEGYSISGGKAAVDAYIADKQVIGTDAIGGLKTAYILGNTPANIPANLEISRLDLQKLFIQLTNS